MESYLLNTDDISTNAKMVCAKLSKFRENMVTIFDLSTIMGIEEKSTFLGQLVEIIHTECNAIGRAPDSNILELALDCTKICLRDKSLMHMAESASLIDDLMLAMHCSDITVAANVASIRCLTNVLNLNAQAVRIFVGLNGFLWLVKILQSNACGVKMFYSIRLFYMLICQRYGIYHPISKYCLTLSQSISAGNDSVGGNLLSSHPSTHLPSPCR